MEQYNINTVSASMRVFSVLELDWTTKHCNWILEELDHLVNNNDFSYSRWK